MKVSSILAISVFFKLQKRVVLQNIFSLNMKVSSILVIIVIIKLQHRVIFRNIFSLNMEVSSILAINAIIELHSRAIFRDIFSESTNSIDHRFFFRPFLISHHNCFFPVLRNTFFYPALPLKIFVWYPRGSSLESERMRLTENSETSYVFSFRSSWNIFLCLKNE